MALNTNKPICENLTVTQGTDFKKTFQILDSNDAAIDITNSTALFVVKPEKGSGTTSLSISTADSAPNSRVDIATGTDGKIDVIITDTDTAAFTAFTEGKYMLTITDSNGIIDPVSEGDFLIVEDI